MLSRNSAIVDWRIRRDATWIAERSRLSFDSEPHPALDDDLTRCVALRIAALQPASRPGVCSHSAAEALTSLTSLTSSAAAAALARAAAEQ